MIHIDITFCIPTLASQMWPIVVTITPGNIASRTVVTLPKEAKIWPARLTKQSQLFVGIAQHLTDHLQHST